MRYYGECRKYGKKSFISKIRDFLKLKNGWFKYSTIRESHQWVRLKKGGLKK